MFVFINIQCKDQKALIKIKNAVNDKLKIGNFCSIDHIWDKKWI